MTKAQHTPGILKAEKVAIAHISKNKSPDVSYLVSSKTNKNKYIIARNCSEADASRIVNCWNNHDDLLEAVEAARPYIEEWFEGFHDPDREGVVLELIDKALTKAKGESS